MFLLFCFLHKKKDFCINFFFEDDYLLSSFFKSEQLSTKVFYVADHLLLLLLLFGHPGALARMDLPRARERNKILVARFWSPGVWNCLILPPQKSNAMTSKTFPDKKWVKTPTKNEKTTITAKQPCIYQGDIYIRSAHLTLILPNMTVKFKGKKLHCHARAGQ